MLDKVSDSAWLSISYWFYSIKFENQKNTKVKCSMWVLGVENQCLSQPVYNRCSSYLKKRHIVRRVSTFNRRKYPLTERMSWHGLQARVCSVRTKVRHLWTTRGMTDQPWDLCWRKEPPWWASWEPTRLGRLVVTLWIYERNSRGCFSRSFPQPVDFKEQHFLGTPNFADNLPSRGATLASAPAAPLAWVYGGPPLKNL